MCLISLWPSGAHTSHPQLLLRPTEHVFYKRRKPVPALWLVDFCISARPLALEFAKSSCRAHNRLLGPRWLNSEMVPLTMAGPSVSLVIGSSDNDEGNDSQPMCINDEMVLHGVLLSSGLSQWRTRGGKLAATVADVNVRTTVELRP